MIEFKNHIYAIWESKEFDVPIIITGMSGKLNGQYYFTIIESNSSLPYNEIQFNTNDKAIIDMIIKILEDKEKAERI